MQEPLRRAGATSSTNGVFPDEPQASFFETIESARAGSIESFGVLSERCRAYLLHVANGELGDDLKAKIGASDLVQETLVQAQQAIGRFRGESEEELLTPSRFQYQCL